jgi:hypothetical protein
MLSNDPPDLRHKELEQETFKWYHWLFIFLFVIFFIYSVSCGINANRKTEETKSYKISILNCDGSIDKVYYTYNYKIGENNGVLTLFSNSENPVFIKRDFILEIYEPEVKK